MKKIKLGKHKLEIYDSISDLPVIRYQAYNKMLLIDAGVGSDMEAFDAHLQKAMKFIKIDPAKAVKELDNLRQNVFLVQSELSPRHLAFCALIETLDGEVQNDLTSEGLQKLAEKLGSVAVAELEKLLSSIKKKIETELELYFPSLFDNASEREYYSILNRRTKAVLESIIEDQDREEQIDRLEKQLLSYQEPKTFHGRGSVEIKFDKSFETMCVALSKSLNVNAKKYTVMEYYSAFEYIKEDGRKSNKV